MPTWNGTGIITQIDAEPNFFWDVEIESLGKSWTCWKDRNKPLVLDARCLLRVIDAVTVWKSPEQAQKFSDSYSITLSGGHPSQGDKPTSTPKSDKAHIWNPPADNIMAVVCSSCAMVLVVLGVWCRRCLVKISYHAWRWQEKVVPLQINYL